MSGEFEHHTRVDPPPPQGTRGGSPTETWELAFVHLSPPPPHHENGKM